MLTALFGTDDPEPVSLKPVSPAPQRRSSGVSFRHQAYVPPPVQTPIDPYSVPIETLREMIGYASPDE